MLGSGRWEAWLQLRGGEAQVAPLGFGRLACSRQLNDMGSGSVVLPTSGRAYELARRGLVTTPASALPWVHELSLRRDGVEGWVGPCSEPAWEIGDASRPAQWTLPARDLFQWFERRFLETPQQFFAADIAEIFAAYAEDALSRDTSPNIAVVVSPTGIYADREIEEGFPPRAADELRELARTGLDWTFVGRTLRIGGVEIAGAQLPMLTPDVFEVRRFARKGLESATEWWGQGGTPEGQGQAPVVVSGGVDEVYGLVQQGFSEPSVLDEESLQAQADGRAVLSLNPPEPFSGVFLPSYPADFSDLVCGARAEARLDIDGMMLDGTYRLTSLDVAYEADGMERITGNFEPLGVMGS